MKDKAFIILSGLFFLIFFIGIGVVTLDRPVSNILRAKNVNPSPFKSFVIAFPQVGITSDSSKSDMGKEIKVTVTMRDVNGVILPDRQIKLTPSLNSVVIKPANIQTTNNTGQAVFFLSSKDPGTVKLTVNDIETNMKLENVPSVEFTE